MLALGDVDGFRQNLETQLEAVERTRYYSETYLVSASRAAIATAEGDLAAAERDIVEYAGDQRGNVTSAVTSAAQLYTLRQMQGKLGELEPAWRLAVARWPGLPIMHAGLALVLASGGKEAEAATELDELTGDNLENIPRDFVWKPTLYLAADACAEMEYQPPATVLYDALLSYASTHSAITNIVAQGSVARVLGRLAALLERWNGSERHFETALAENKRVGFHAWTTWTRLNYGDMLLRRDGSGDREKARALLEQALEEARAMGMAKVVEDCERLLGGSE